MKRRKNKAAQVLGRKGGIAKNKKLTKEQRKELMRKVWEASVAARRKAA